MKFIVSRTSTWNKIPCEEAKLDSIVVDDVTIDVWFIEIDTIEELVKFVDKYGDIVVQDYPYDGHKEIEIYDTWRE